MTAPDFELLTNPEVIVIDQDPLTKQGARLLPLARARSRIGASVLPHVPGFLRGVARSNFALTARALAAGHAGGTAAGRLPSSHARKYLSVAWAHLERQGFGSRAEAERHSLDAAYVADALAAGLRSPAGGQSEVWARNLTGGDVAVLLFNNNQTDAQTIECSGSCWVGMGFGPTQTVRVRDVFARRDLGSASGRVSAQGIAKDDSALLRLSPE